MPLDNDADREQHQIFPPLPTSLDESKTRSSPRTLLHNNVNYDTKSHLAAITTQNEWMQQRWPLQCAACIAQSEKAAF